MNTEESGSALDGDESGKSKKRFILWKFQKEAIQSVMDALKDKGPKDDVRVSVCAPTGSGKTVMIFGVIQEFWKAFKEDQKRRAGGSDGSDSEDEADRPQVLILVPSIQTAVQMKREADRILRDRFKAHFSVALEQGGQNVDGYETLVIATWQSLGRPARAKKLGRERFGLVIVDECHHAASPQFMRILQYFNDCIELPDGVTPIAKLQHGTRVPIVGFSATPDREDKRDITDVFTERVYTVDVKLLIKNKKLSRLSYKMIDGGLNNEELMKQCTESEEDMANWTPEDRENRYYDMCNAAIINEHQSHFDEGRKYTLVFVSRLRQLYSLKIAFGQIKVDVEYITGSTKKDKRKGILDNFRAGITPVLINCATLLEGVDLPCIDCIVLARPTSSKTLATQMIGRGMRISEETKKKDCLILDFTESPESGLKNFSGLYELVKDLGAFRVRATKPKARQYGADQDGADAEGHRSLMEAYEVVAIPDIDFRTEADNEDKAVMPSGSIDIDAVEDTIRDVLGPMVGIGQGQDDLEDQKPAVTCLGEKSVNIKSGPVDVVPPKKKSKTKRKL